MRWSETVRDYYEVNPRPRWGHGIPVHPEIRRVLERTRGAYESTLSDMERFRQILHQIPFDKTGGSMGVPFWYNGWFSTLDAAALVYFLLTRKPQKYIEIGSGFSTMFARYTIRLQSLGTHLTSIDPRPRAEIDGLCDAMIRTSLEDCDLGLFMKLEPGDMLFFDGSHRVFENSDVTVFFLEILPRLRPGVLVHIHDIFLPSDYIPRWSERLYSEQYLLAAMLLCDRRPFEVVLPNYFICTDSQLSKYVERIFKGDEGKHNIPMNYSNGSEIPGVSFWIETVKMSVVQ